MSIHLSIVLDQIAIIHVENHNYLQIPVTHRADVRCCCWPEWNYKAITLPVELTNKLKLDL